MAAMVGSLNYGRVRKDTGFLQSIGDQSDCNIHIRERAFLFRGTPAKFMAVSSGSVK
jgi:hypothetical protein